MDSARPIQEQVEDQVEEQVKEPKLTPKQQFLQRQRDKGDAQNGN